MLPHLIKHVFYQILPSRNWDLSTIIMLLYGWSCESIKYEVHIMHSVKDDKMLSENVVISYSIINTFFSGSQALVRKQGNQKLAIILSHLQKLVVNNSLRSQKLTLGSSRLQKLAVIPSHLQKLVALLSHLQKQAVIVSHRLGRCQEALVRVRKYRARKREHQGKELDRLCAAANTAHTGLRLYMLITTPEPPKPTPPTPKAIPLLTNRSSYLHTHW